MAGRLSRRTLRRAVVAAVAVAAAAALHAGMIWLLGDRLASLGERASMPPRIEVAYVRELQPAPPPTLAPAAPRVPRPPRPARAPKRAVAPDRPASSPLAEKAGPASRGHARAPSDEATLAAAAPAASAAIAASVEPPADLAGATAAVGRAVPAAPTASAASADRIDAAGSAVPAAPTAPTASAAAADRVDPGGSGAAAAAAATPSAPAASDPAAPAAKPFEWPASTRLRYALTGYYRGDLDGRAQVEWVHDGPHYQVHVDITVGLPFAPLLQRRMSSDGELTADGLVPRRYDEDSHLAFQPRRHATVRFGAGQVVLADGQRRPALPGMQDSASQFVQLAWRFGLQPSLLTVGRSVEVPLALPRSTGTWVYDVVARETLYTDVGALDTFHLKPRRPPRPGVEMSVEMWFAPALRYLPVRLLIHHDAQTFIDLRVDRLPELAAR